MSNIKNILVVLAAAVVTAGFTACTPKDDFTDILADDDYVYTEDKAEKEEPAEEQSGESKAQIKKLADKALERLEKMPEYPAGYPPLDDVVPQYKKANTAIGWILKTEVIATDPADTYKSDGMTYQRVKPDCHLGIHNHAHGEEEQLIYNKKTLEAYIATLIHPEEAKDYMIDLDEGYDVPRLVTGTNGALYALTFSFSPTGYGEEETYELSKNSDGSYTFTVNYTVKGKDGKPDRQQQHSFPYVKVDGRWVFENFIVLKQ